MKICRLCLSTDEGTNYHEFDAKLKTDCLFVCGITVRVHSSLVASENSKKLFFVAD